VYGQLQLQLREAGRCSLLIRGVDRRVCLGRFMFPTNAELESATGKRGTMELRGNATRQIIIDL
jgi:hypothetical protein